MYTRYTYGASLLSIYFQTIFYAISVVIYVHVVYIRNMKESIITFRGSLELRQAIEAEAKKQDRSVSYIIEQLVRESAIRKKILKKT